MKCPLCISTIPDDSAFCTNCGARINKQQQSEPSFQNASTYNAPTSQNAPPTYNNAPNSSINHGQYRSDDAGCFALIISFLSSYVGFALYLVWRDYRPNSAKACLITACVSLGLSIISGIISYIMLISIYSTYLSQMQDGGYIIESILRILSLKIA